MKLYNFLIINIKLKFYKKNNFIIMLKMGIGDWGLGIGEWGLGPIPNPQSPLVIYKYFVRIIKINIFLIKIKIIIN